jgi:hypothetical protein
LDRAVNAPTARVNLYWENTFSDITNFADLRVARYNGSQWVNVGSTATSGVPAGPGTITSGNVSTFSPFTFASLSGINPLPVELINFSAYLKNSSVQLTWETASEFNNDFFTVERAFDTENFEDVSGKIEGKGTTKEKNFYSFADNNPIYGKSYYRLKQTDFDGTITYSEWKVIDYEGPEFPYLNIYPIPNDGSHIIIEAKGLKEPTELPVTILNSQGQEVFRRTLFVKTPGSLQEEIVFDHPLSAGLYIVKAGRTYYLTKKMIVE